MKVLNPILLAAILLVCPAAGWAADTESRPPNIVLIMADDLGYEAIGAYGAASWSTPRLDQLAATGMRFEHAYSQPLCTPSRVQIMTGIYNIRNYTEFGVMDRSQRTFAHLLKEAGYATAIAGKWQLGREPDSPRHFGFDESLLWQHTSGRTDSEGHDTRYENPHLDRNGERIRVPKSAFGPDSVTDFVIDFMDRHRDQPFFVYFPMIFMHCPFVPVPGHPDYDPESPGSPTYKGDPRYFADMITHMDANIGRIVDQLENLGLQENTLILFTGDNGTDRPIVTLMRDGSKVAGGKREMTDAGTRVPLIANWPGTVPAGQVSGELVDFSDFLPTFGELAGVPVEQVPEVDGRSFVSQLKGEAGETRQWIYCWFSRNGGPDGRAWARNQRYKLYASGEFYDVRNDVLEEYPLSFLSLEQVGVRVRLQEVLNAYSSRRYDALPEAPTPSN